MPRIFLLACLLAGMTAGAAGGPYPVYTVPAALLKNANVVKRAHTTTFEILSTKSTRLRYSYALTILNANGDDYAGFSEYYDRFRDIESLEGYLYNAEGKLLKKVKGKDFRDVSADDEVNIVHDNRVRYHDFNHRTYPYTVEYEVSITINQTFALPSWFPQGYSHLSVEKSIFQVIVPSDYDLRYKMMNLKGRPAETSEKGKKILTWEVQNLLPRKREAAGPEWSELTPSVRLAPSAFEMDGYKGNMTSWESFGQFIQVLNKDRDILPEPVKQQVAQITAPLGSDREKVVALYAFLQQHTRYISIQLGIGGFQPFDAASVYKKGYGDCKALSNYMYSLLREAGIRSHYTLIRGGDFDYSFMEDFPSTQFNHVILCVPLQRDTLWLECTDQSVSAGYMGAFTGNRKALLISEEGSRLVNTPAYSALQNLQQRRIEARIDEEGSLRMKASTSYTGIQQDDLSARINHLTRDKVKKDLEEDLQLATYEVNDFSYSLRKGVVPEVDEMLDITVSNYATITGRRLFVVPNIISRSNYRIAADTARTVDYVYLYPYRDEDRAEIQLPEGYTLEARPPDVSIDTKYGKYLSTVTLEGNRIIYTRAFEKGAGRFPPAEGAALAKFHEDVYKADRARLVLVRK